MNYCPHCGLALDKPLLDGITTCNRCGRVFDSNNRNKLLSAAWLVRREHIYDIEMLKFKCDISESEFLLISHYVIDMGFCHDEFVKFLNSHVVTAA
jgi:hypothetical protein